MAGRVLGYRKKQTTLSDMTKKGPVNLRKSFHSAHSKSPLREGHDRHRENEELQLDNVPVQATNFLPQTS